MVVYKTLKVIDNFQYLLYTLLKIKNTMLIVSINVIHVLQRKTPCAVESTPGS